MIKRLLLSITVVTGILSCTTEEIGNSKDVNPDTIYTTYTTTYNEAAGTVRNRAQFRFAGKDGTTLVLSDSSNIKLDGRSITIDSTKFIGAFYDVKMPATEFIGKHTWVFTDIKGKVYEESFSFEPVRLKTPIPASIKVAELRLGFSGVSNSDLISITIMDTSKNTFDQTGYKVNNSEVLIPATAFKQLKSGPIEFLFQCRRETPIKNAPKEGGLIVAEFELKNGSTNLAQ